MLYTISPKCRTDDNQSLVLSISDAGHASVQIASSANEFSLFSLVYSFSTNGFVMVHKSTGKLVTVTKQTIGKASMLGLVDFESSDINTNTAWDLESSSGGFAVRPKFNVEFDLNVLGDGPYHPGNIVAAYRGWAGGAQNEVWTFQVVDASAPFGWFHSINPLCNKSLALAVSHADPYGEVVVNDLRPEDDAQLWSPIYAILPKQDHGVIFVNKLTGRCLKAKNDKSDINTTPLTLLDQHSIWSTEDLSQAAFALHPLYNPVMAMNVFGAGPYHAGNSVGTWPYASEHTNSKWAFQLTDSSLASVDIRVETSTGYTWCMLVSSEAKRSCVVRAANDATDLTFRLGDLQDYGIGFTVSDSQGNVYKSESRGTKGIWAVEAEGAAGLKLFYTSAPIPGYYTATVSLGHGVAKQWKICGSTNTDFSHIKAPASFSHLSPGKKKAIENVVKQSGEVIPHEFCLYCLAQGYVIAGLLFATFVSWAGPVAATSAIVLYISRFMGSSPARIVKNVETMRGIWKNGGPDSNLYKIVRWLCQEEGFCPKIPRMENTETGEESSKAETEENKDLSLKF